MADVQTDFELLANLNSLKVPELKKALKERGISIANSAKKPDLIAKLTEALTASTSKVADESVDDDFEQQLAEITEGKASVSLATSSAEPPLNLQKKTDLIKPSQTIVTGSSLPRTGTTNTSTTSQANGTSNVTSGKVSVSASSASSASPLSSSKSSNESNIKKVTAAAPSVHPLDKLAARAARFGSLEEDQKGAPSSKPATASVEIEALKKRKDRFGVSVSTSLKELEAHEKLALRASRFGSSATDTEAPSGIKRLSSGEDEKLKRRRERFGI